MSTQTRSDAWTFWVALGLALSVVAVIGIVLIISSGGSPIGNPVARLIPAASTEPEDWSYPELTRHLRRKGLNVSISRHPAPFGYVNDFASVYVITWEDRWGHEEVKVERFSSHDAAMEAMKRRKVQIEMRYFDSREAGGHLFVWGNFLFWTEGYLNRMDEVRRAL